MSKAENDSVYKNGLIFLLKFVLVIWAISIMGYFYYSRGYVELFRQLGALIIG